MLLSQINARLDALRAAAEAKGIVFKPAEAPVVASPKVKDLKPREKSFKHNHALSSANNEARHKPKKATLRAIRDSIEEKPLVENSFEDSIDAPLTDHDAFSEPFSSEEPSAEQFAQAAKEFIAVDAELKEFQEELKQQLDLDTDEDITLEPLPDEMVQALLSEDEPEDYAAAVRLVETVSKIQPSDTCSVSDSIREEPAVIPSRVDAVSAVFMLPGLKLLLAACVVTEEECDALLDKAFPPAPSTFEQTQADTNALIAQATTELARNNASLVEIDEQLEALGTLVTKDKTTTLLPPPLPVQKRKLTIEKFFEEYGMAAKKQAAKTAAKSTKAAKETAKDAPKKSEGKTMGVLVPETLHKRMNKFIKNNAGKKGAPASLKELTLMALRYTLDELEAST